MKKNRRQKENLLIFSYQLTRILSYSIPLTESQGLMFEIRSTLDYVLLSCIIIMLVYSLREHEMPPPHSGQKRTNTFSIELPHCSNFDHLVGR